MRRQLSCLLLVFLLLGGSGAPFAVAGEAPALLLADTYRQQVDVAQYLVSEKLDGIRAYWDGERLWTRNGHPLRAPEWFVAGLPRQALDGELWLGRGRFEAMSAVARRDSPRDDDWRDVRYMLFELPGAPGSFSDRVEQMKALVAASGRPWLQAVDQFRVADHAALSRRLTAVLKAGGEGLMLHRADAPYTTGRSDVLLKVKPWLDAEAVVIAHLPGRGRHAVRTGALRVRTPDGREFSLGSGLSDAERDNPPPLGSTVTYRYRELTSRGLPRFASFWRRRDEP